MLIRNNGPHKILESLLYAYEKYSKENKPQEVVLNGDMAQEFNDMHDTEFDEDEYVVFNHYQH